MDGLWVVSHGVTEVRQISKPDDAGSGKNKRAVGRNGEKKRTSQIVDGSRQRKEQDRPSFLLGWWVAAGKVRRKSDPVYWQGLAEKLQNKQVS